MTERRAIAVRGIVQGVGFRPYVYALASRLQLRGSVRNYTGGVWIEVEGERPVLDRFVHELGTAPPPLSRIAELSWQELVPLGDHEFRIEASAADSAGTVFISPDVAVCRDCLAELVDPADRRVAYPFLNCTNCGPRLTIVTAAPYDRERTTMTSFPMCDACRAEYEDPLNRRFHAQPTACAQCGPAVRLHDATGAVRAVPEPVAEFAAAVRAGKIGALKGLGGYHLVCDARNATAVAALRQRKHRDEKPFALMLGSTAAAAELATVGPVEKQLLESARAPIVLLRRRAGAPVADAVAPGNPYLGVMLPYTPLHHLLLLHTRARPLVMTSGNRADEPIAYDDADALARLAGIADLFLTHNRPIHVRCDDSVTRVVAGAEAPMRRSRGYAPEPIALPLECRRPTLAVGGQLKGTFALGRGRHAFLSHHLGDLDHYEAYRAFVRDIDLYQQLFAVAPELLVHDLHPDYASTRYALERMNQQGSSLRLLAVQHHHAHVASCMAEHGLTEPVIGVAFDGTGFGTDGAVWGGEFLVGDYRQFRRAAHLRYVPMPGGEQAIREPWRMAAAHLADADVARERLLARIPAGSLRVVEQMLQRRVQTPLTSSAGRLFDAVAVLAGVRDRVSYEGQAAIALEWLATDITPDRSYGFRLESAVGEPGGPFVVDTRPLIRDVAEDVQRGVDQAQIAGRFHATVVDLISAVCHRLREATGVGEVVLSGGVFMNARLLAQTESRLQRAGFRVCRHQRVPANDGGLALGQLAIAAAVSDQQ